MRVSDKEYRIYTKSIAKNIFRTALCSGVQEYDQKIVELVTTSSDILDVIFPLKNNYLSLHNCMREWETTGCILIIDHDASATDDLFKLKEL